MATSLRVLALSCAVGLPLMWPGQPAAQDLPGTAPGGTGAAEFVPATPDTIRDVQQMLSDLGYPVGMVDGRLGPQTQDALRRFQNDMGLANPLPAGDTRIPSIVIDSLHARTAGAGAAPSPGSTVGPGGITTPGTMAPGTMAPGTQGPGTLGTTPNLGTPGTVGNGGGGTGGLGTGPGGTGPGGTGTPSGGTGTGTGSGEGTGGGAGGATGGGAGGGGAGGSGGGGAGGGGGGG